MSQVKKTKLEEVIQPVFCNDSEDEEYGEHPEVIQLAEQNVSGNTDSAGQNEKDIDEDEDEDENEEEEEEEEEEQKNSSIFPSEPVSFILVMMIMMLQGRHLTDSAAQIVMFFLNMVLSHLELDYRFPKTLATFTSRMDYQDSQTPSRPRY
ncbi:hypothetical protein G6F56_011823 [Rhizopus delemar]|nr:hypothetical protein G6F56_011823 [Rhizopus delemar]